MANYTIFLDVRKSEERQASKKFDNKCSENSRSQIVFRTDIFQKLTLGAPDTTPTFFAVDTLLACEQAFSRAGWGFPFLAIFPQTESLFTG